MKKILLVTVLGFGLVGCDKLAKIGSDVCGGEVKAHSVYVSFIAPFRPAEKVASELAFYNRVMALCAAGAPPSQVNAAAAKADAARQ